MFPQDDKDQRLLNWIAERLVADEPDQEAEELDRLLGTVPGTPFTDAEVQRILLKAQGKLPPDGEIRPSEENGSGAGPLSPPRPLQFPSWPGLLGLAAAACLLLALGWVIWNANQTRQDDPTPGTLPPLAETKPLPGHLPDLVPRPFPEEKLLPPGKSFPLAQGLGTLRLTSPGKVALLDADEGLVQLDQGSVYLELCPQAGVEVEVKTPLGMITAGDSRCYIGFLEKCAGPTDRLLAVLVLDGQVEFHNTLGFEIAEAGELILVRPDQNPDKTGPALLSAEDHYWCQSQEMLRLLQDAEIQDHLDLDESLEKKLNQPLPEEAQRVAALFQNLPESADHDRKKMVGDFFRHQAEQAVALLDAAQQQKFQQLHLQHVGFNALVRKEVSEQLNLTSKQKEQIQGQLRKYSKTKHSLFTKDSHNSLELGKSLANLEQQLSSSVLKLLKPNQIEQWKKMAGQSWSPGGRSRFTFLSKGIGFQLTPVLNKSEEQLWEFWLHKTAKRTRMTSPQLNQARQLLQQAKKEAAEYRKSKQQDFNELTSEFLRLLKSKKLDKQARQALEEKFEALHLPVAEIGGQWKEQVLQLLTPTQQKSLEQSRRKEPYSSMSPVFFPGQNFKIQPPRR